MAEIAYIDESYDSSVFAMSALVVPMHAWRECFTSIRDWRRDLKQRYGIFTTKELHATDFVAGRGRIGTRPIPKALRVAIFREAMYVLTRIPVRVISGAWPFQGNSKNTIHVKAFGRIQDRLQRRCVAENGQIIRIVDEGRDVELRKVARKAAVMNPVGSKFGAWEDGARAKNILTERLIEDPVFKSSQQSYFLQMADFIAFALLKSEVAPSPRVARYRLDEMYRILAPVCAIEASPGDPKKLGIVRS